MDFSEDTGIRQTWEQMLTLAENMGFDLDQPITILRTVDGWRLEQEEHHGTAGTPNP